MALLSMAVVRSKVVVKFLTQCVLLLPMCVRARARACVRAIVCVCVGGGGWVQDSSAQNQLDQRQLGPRSKNPTKTIRPNVKFKR